MSIITEYTCDDYVFSDTTDYSGLSDFLSDNLNNLDTQICKYVFNTNVRKVQSSNCDYDIYSCICKNIIISICTHYITGTQKEQYIAFTQLNINTESCEITKIHALRVEIPSNLELSNMGVFFSNNNGKFLMGIQGSTFILPPKSFFLAGIHKDATTITDLTILYYEAPTSFKKSN